MAQQYNTASGYPQLVSDTATVAPVASSLTAVTLQASNFNRIHWSCFNDSTAVLYLKWGNGASSTSYTTKVQPQGFYELPREKYYAGIITGAWATANGFAYCTEAV